MSTDDDVVRPEWTDVRSLMRITRPADGRLLTALLPPDRVGPLIDWANEVGRCLTRVLWDSAVSPDDGSLLTGRRREEWSVLVPGHAREVVAEVLGAVARMVDSAAAWGTRKLRLQLETLRADKRTQVLGGAIRSLEQAIGALESLELDWEPLRPPPSVRDRLVADVSYLRALLARSRIRKHNIIIRSPDHSSGKPSRGPGKDLDLDWYFGRIHELMRQVGRRSHDMRPAVNSSAVSTSRPAGGSIQPTCWHCPPLPPSNLPRDLHGMWRLQHLTQPCSWVTHDGLKDAAAVHLLTKLHKLLKIAGRANEGAVGERVERYRSRIDSVANVIEEDVADDSVDH